VSAFAAELPPPIQDFPEEIAMSIAWTPLSSCDATTKDHEKEFNGNGGCENGGTCLTQSTPGRATERDILSSPLQQYDSGPSVTFKQEEPSSSFIVASARASPLFDQASLFARTTIKRE